MIFNNLKTVRVAFGETQPETAKAVKMSVPSYSKLENGKRDVKISEIKAVMEHFELTQEQVWMYFFCTQTVRKRKKAS